MTDGGSRPSASARAGEGGQGPYLEVTKLSKHFGSFVALKSIDLAIQPHEFVCFLGPSGCGKTTLLRIIAGLDTQTTGRILQGGKDVSAAPVSERDFGIVFQSYALFPNLTVAKNVGYGLVSRGMKRRDIEARIAELLTLVGLPDSGGKYPAQLSGGQQQRVALARALATSPGLLLLDEPLSALDARVRVRLRHEIRALQRRLGITTIMVTHDQEEALSMADRIVVMNHGDIEQIGTPLEIYRRPASPFVADFVGSMNFLQGKVLGEGRVRLGPTELACATDGFAAGDEVGVCVRPEDVMVRNVAASTANRVGVTVGTLDFLGAFCRATLKPDGDIAPVVADFSINLMRDLAVAEGQRLEVALPADRLRLFHKT
jgi:iron(III) transport system ATP-binding protein